MVSTSYYYYIILVYITILYSFIGKTTFLNALAGTIPSKSLKLIGNVHSDFELENPIFVQQEDLLFPQLTVEETLTTSATLKALQSSTSTNTNSKTMNNNIKSSVSDFTLDLGLKKISKSYVGDAKTRGISGTH